MFSALLTEFKKVRIQHNTANFTMADLHVLQLEDKGVRLEAQFHFFSHGFIFCLKPFPSRLIHSLQGANFVI